jgi:hypothetical protein
MMENERRIDIGGILIGINVIIIGLYLLLAMLGVVSFGYLPSLLKLWPIILIAIGLDIIFRAFSIKHVGSVVFTVFLILAIVASTPGTTGVGVRDFFRMNQEPAKWDANFFNTVVDGIKNYKVIETKEENIPMESMPTKFRIAYDETVKNLFITVKKSEKPSCAMKLEILDEVALFRTNSMSAPELVAKPVGKEKESIFVLDKVESKGNFCNVYLDVSLAQTTEISINSNLRKFQLTDDWQANVNLGNATNCEVTTKNVNDFSIAFASGFVNIGNCNNCTISTASADVTLGDSTGKTDIKTASGEISVGMTKEVSLFSISGEIKAKSVSNNSRISTVSGEVFVEDARNSDGISVETTSGSIDIGRLSTKGLIKVRSVSGDVEVSLEKDANLIVNASTLSGETEITGKEIMPTGNFKKSVSVGAGGSGTLEISTTSGDIGVTQ